MKYMTLIDSEPGVPDFKSEEQAQAEMGAWFAFTQRIVESGELISGEPLQGIETATTVSARDGETLVTHGPFAETKEVLGGDYLVDVASRERTEELAPYSRRPPTTVTRPAR